MAVDAPPNPNAAPGGALPHAAPGGTLTQAAPGGTLTIDDLPPPDTTRWVMRRKAQVVNGVRQGVLSLHDACARYNLSEEEFLSWQRLIDTHGPRALRVTRLQDYRGQGRRKRGPKTTNQNALP